MPTPDCPRTPPAVVRLVKAGREKVRYDATVVGDDGERVTVTAAWCLPTVRDFGSVRFEPGDLFTEHYWRDRWYSVKEVRAADGTLKGWAATSPAPVTVAGATLTSEDLDLDLWVGPDGPTYGGWTRTSSRPSGLAARDPEAAERAVRALDELEAIARRGALPALAGPA